MLALATARAISGGSHALSDDAASRHRHRYGRRVAADRERDALAFTAEALAQIQQAPGPDRLTVDGGDDVAFAEAGIGCGGVRHDEVDQNLREIGVTDEVRAT